MRRIIYETKEALRRRHTRDEKPEPIVEPPPDFINMNQLLDEIGRRKGMFFIYIVNANNFKIYSSALQCDEPLLGLTTITINETMSICGEDENILASNIIDVILNPGFINGTGYLYFIIESPYEGRIQLGVTEDVDNFLRGQKGGRANLFIYRTIYTRDPIKLLKRIHRAHRDRHLTKNWYRFTLPECDVLYNCYC